MKFVFLFLLFSLQVAFGSEALTTNEMKVVIAKVKEKASQYGTENVLLVLDIDNTILTSVNELGSDQWYSWQEKIMKEPNCEPLCITKDPMALIKAQGLLFTMGKMKPTEPTLPSQIGELQASGVKIILLTSRGTDFRNLTETSLAENNMNFAVSTFNVDRDFAGNYLPYNISDLAASGLTEKDVSVAGLREARPVSFMNGIYMTAGQNKGIMLKTLLNRWKKSFQAIVFADDHQRHVDRMQAIMGELVDLTTYRYGAIDPDVKRFNESDKKTVTEQWYKLQDTIKAIGF